ncbi:MAG: hypothetical protein WAL71_04910 [Terriglobales bacterium]|jgi:hypothetical protein
MSDRGWMEPIVERVVSQVLENHASQLRREIVRRVTEEIAAQPGSGGALGSPAAPLARAVADIQLGTSQREILHALIASSSCCAARIALFVVKAGGAAGWQARGFTNGAAIKDFALDAAAPAVLRAIGDRTASSAAASEFDSRFFAQFGKPAGEARLLPLILKDKVAALVYADGGTDGALLDTSALEVLVLSASAWLEVNALRKQAHKDGSVASAPTAGAGEASPASAHNDPFAAQTPAHAKAAAASAGTSEAAAAAAGATEVSANAHSASVEVQSAAVATPGVATGSSQVGHVQSELQTGVSDAPALHPHTLPEPTASPALPEHLSPQDQDIHDRARRFARLLVDEIKLYNQAKVVKGRKDKDLCERLKDEIEKSRSTYQQRYGNTVAASGNYFQHELLRSLAEDDASAMGPNFSL